ncbi:MAG: hypothetical protein J6A63_06535, partial [Clostridia bacterium]|nr:hypothetical protein [Clostridia bacterium]
GDEPSYQNAWCYGQVYQSIKRVMPECYVQYNLNPLQHDNYNMVKYWYDGSTPARSTPTNEETEAAYKNYVKAFLDAMGTDYIQYDDYPFKSECNNNILGICRSDTTYVDPTALRNIQIIAEIAQERNLTVKVVTQSCHMTDGKSGHDRIRQITEEDARWLNNYLMGFGVKQISYFTYWTKAANSATGETFIDGGSFVNRNGETTALYDIMKAIMTENTAFAKTISHFDYSASNVVTGSKYQFASDHITWGTTMTSGSFKWLTGATTSTDATLVTELYDKEKYNYMYMVMNTIDPYEQNTNGENTTQTITITFDASVTSFYVYQSNGTRTTQTGNNTYTVTLTAGQAIYLMPILEA